MEANCCKKLFIFLFPTTVLKTFLPVQFFKYCSICNILFDRCTISMSLLSPVTARRVHSFSSHFGRQRQKPDVTYASLVICVIAAILFQVSRGECACLHISWDFFSENLQTKPASKHFHFVHFCGIQIRYEGTNHDITTRNPTKVFCECFSFCTSPCRRRITGKSVGNERRHRTRENRTGRQAEKFLSGPTATTR